MVLVYTSVALMLLLGVSCGAQILPATSLISNDWEYQGTTEISVDARFQFPVSDKLYGIFFEEIGHAGEGGIYAEMIQDRSFDALAYTTGFLDSPAQTLVLTEGMLSPSNLSATLQMAPELGHGDLSTLRAEMAQKYRLSNSPERLLLQPKSWFPTVNTSAALTKLQPLNKDNTIALNISADGEEGGIINTGYWGISISEGKTYQLSIHLAAVDDASLVRVALESTDGRQTYASASLEPLASHWKKFKVNLTAGATDGSAQLRISFKGPGSVLVDSVSLFPGENIVEGLINPWPFRPDLVEALKGLEPKFLRVPGGCVVEGNILKEAFHWKKSIGPNDIRPGHWDLWGYWNTDGLGMFEYLLLAEELDAVPVWVANNGVSHQESIAVQDLGPWIQSALDSLEFAMGGVWTPWGAVRREMGHPKPFNISHFAIGNEDCGHAWYVENYRAFFDAIRRVYPHMQLIANCDLRGDQAPVQEFDWHIYTSQWDLINRQHEFDNMVPGADPLVFASEYAVTADGGWGNLKGALAEATFMTGMERNSEVVHMASFAPLFSNVHDHWWQTDLIMFNATQWYGIPSYYVQKLFSAAQGVSYVLTAAQSDTSFVHNELAAASATCQDSKCSKLALKVVNNGGFRSKATVTIKGLSQSALNTTARADVLTGAFPEIENSLDHPRSVFPKEEFIHLHPANASGSSDVDAAAFTFSLPPNALVVLHLDLDIAPGSEPKLATRNPHVMSSLMALKHYRSRTDTGY
ncbi:hypothetical protein WJX73_006123 [Symbiochloris irregularis]|uniref:non-reducing end alpha-L-arabinofuranosidase n=1 Tax=Symbiochloris irregularis TaxID=706552 RepID=A0AAW1P114_9CHLO